MINNLINASHINWQKTFDIKHKQSKDSALKEYYAASVPSSMTPIEETTFLAIDFDTTGLDSNHDDHHHRDSPFYS